MNATALLIPGASPWTPGHGSFGKLPCHVIPTPASEWSALLSSIGALVVDEQVERGGVGARRHVEGESEHRSGAQPARGGPRDVPRPQAREVPGERAVRRPDRIHPECPGHGPAGWSRARAATHEIDVFVAPAIRPETAVAPTRRREGAPRPSVGADVGGGGAPSHVSAAVPRIAVVVEEHPHVPETRNSVVAGPKRDGVLRGPVGDESPGAHGGRVDAGTGCR